MLVPVEARRLVFQVKLMIGQSSHYIYTQSLSLIIHVFRCDSICINSMCINGRQTSSVSKKADEDDYSENCVDYRGVNFKIGESGSIDGCNRCYCGDGEGNAYWEGCTK